MNTDRQKEAIALKYGETDIAPIVKAKGKGYVAKNIIENAKEHDVPIHEDEALVEILSKVNIEEAIPQELYQAVAEVFAFIYQLDKKLDR